ncbi:MAG TPA: hypothetical protein VMH81_01260 [Bryobacteraceae bacterium]|nr:hypothetical protein [Bryobacteraceae bacterium]
MIEGFPLNDADSDREVQLRIDEDLGNSQAVQASFERAFPKNPAAGKAASIERILKRPKPEELFPVLAISQARGDWLMPALRRFEWNLERGETGAEWVGELAGMIRFILMKVRRVSEPEFLALTRLGPALVANHCVFYMESMSQFAATLEKSGPLSEAVVGALRTLLKLCTQPHGTSGREELFAWPFFRARNNFATDDPCWSACVRRDLETLDAKLRNTWLCLFDADSHYRNEGGANVPSKSCLKAVKQLGNEQLEAGLRRWVAMLAEGLAPCLSPVGSIVFRHLIVLCDLLGGHACDELLYDIARAPWVREEDTRWIQTYLWALQKRTDDRAFACLEALSMNQATSTVEVRRKYEALLAVFGAGALPTTAKGVDGYPLDRDPALKSQQERIDQLLRIGANAAARGPYVDPAVAAHVKALKSIQDQELSPAAKLWAAQLEAPRPWFDGGPEVRASLEAMEASILKEFAADPASLHLAAAHRWEWITSHKREFSEDTLKVWSQSFRGLGCEGGLLQRSLKKVEKLPLESLLRAIKSGPGHMKVFDLCQKYVAEHGWHAGLVERMRKWVSTMGHSATDNYYRAQVEWFLWFEDVVPIDLEACWSHRVKRDLRLMPPEERTAWLRLLSNSTFVVTDRPAKKWFKAAEPAFRQMDKVAFRKRFVAWFTPFDKGEPVKLTVTGRNVLRLLMWYALLAKDSAVDKALAGYSNARWKTRETANRVAQAEMAFSYVLAQRVPERALPILQDLVKSGQAFSGSAAHKNYLELCAQLGRKPIPAVELIAKPAKKPSELAIDQLPAIRRLVPKS